MRTESSSETAMDRVFSGLRAQIIAGILPAGARIVERAVAEEYDVSRLPVRIAIRRLELDGLVDHRARQGSVVRTMSRSDVADISELHSALDRLAVRQAAVRRTEAHRIRFREHLDAAQRAADDGDVERLIEVGTQFRSDAYRAAGNGPLLEIHDAALSRTLRMFALSDPAVIAPMPYFRRIGDACDRRDPLAAEQAMAELSEHIRFARHERVLAQLDEGTSAPLPRAPREDEEDGGDGLPAEVGQLVSELRAAILAGELVPGDTISERVLGERSGLSRIPVRQALDALASEGLTTPASSRVSAKVRALGRQEIDDLFDVCVTLDVLATRLAAQRPTRDEIIALEKELLAVEELAAGQRGDDGRAELLDRMFAFRRRIYLMAENRMLLEIDRVVAARMRLAVAELPLTDEVLRGQRFLFEAIASRETNLAEAIYLNVFAGRTRRDRVFGEGYGRSGEA